MTMASSPILRSDRKRRRLQAVLQQDDNSNIPIQLTSRRKPGHLVMRRGDSIASGIDENSSNHQTTSNNSNSNTESLLLSCSSLTSRSLPMLLDQRQRGHWKQQHYQRLTQNVTSLWRESVLKEESTTKQKRQSKNKGNNNHHHHQWRDYIKRTIPFSELQTPPCDAVLALERHGSYVIAVCGGDGQLYGPWTAPRLALRFYGVPSPSCIEANLNRLPSQKEMGPVLLQTTPLVFESNNSNQDRVSSPLNILDVVMESMSTVASAPFRVLISADWRVGVSFLRHSSTTSDPHSFESATMGPDDGLGTLTIFSLPRMNYAASGTSRTFHCRNVRIGAWNAFTMRNLLWPVPLIPTTATATSSTVPAFVDIRETPGYLLFNDEDDGFRLTWITDSDWVNTPDEGVHPLGESPLPVKPSRNDIVAIPDRCAWEVCHPVDTKGKVVLQGRKEIDGGILVVSEAFLSVEALLSEILQRRKHLLPTRASSDTRPVFPDFSYALIATSPCGRMVDLIITFESKKSSAVGVFLRVDLFTQAYEELDWVRNNNSRAANATSLSKWSNLLALQRRARQMRVGPYIVSPVHDYFGHWGSLRGEVYFEHLDQNEVAVAKSQQEWHEYLDGLKWNAALDATTLKSPTRINYKLLYPDCESITNAAVTKGTPVSHITCQNSPIQIIYE